MCAAEKVDFVCLFSVFVIPKQLLSCNDISFYLFAVGEQPFEAVKSV